MLFPIAETNLERPGRADRFLAPSSEGERDLVSLGIIALGCRRPEGICNIEFILPPKHSFYRFEFCCPFG